MKFSAYMFIRNGIRGGYTFMEAIENVLPFVDEFFVLDGKSDDGTFEALKGMALLDPRLRVESEEPAYMSSPKDGQGLLLGAAFDLARQKCAGDWLVQVQADTVFHPVTVLAARDFLESAGPGWNYDALEVVRHQYRWNWQEMYREDRLALIFRKASGRVAGDAINVAVKGRISRRLLPLFNKFPVADNAWIFFENISGKIAGCAEIWGALESEVKEGNSAWYDSVTGRDFRSDLKDYREKGVLPPFWKTAAAPFADKLPGNLRPLAGSVRYSVSGRFSEKGGIYSPGAVEIAELRSLAASVHIPLLHRLDCAAREVCHSIHNRIRTLLRRGGRAA